MLIHRPVNSQLLFVFGRKNTRASGLQFTPSLFLLFSSTFCLSPSSHMFFLSHSLSSFSFSSFSLISLLPLFSLPLSTQFSLSGSSRPTIVQGNASLTHEDPSPQLSYRLHSWNKKGDQTVTMTTRATCMILKLIMMTTRHV